MGTSVSKSITITAFLVGLIGSCLAIYHLQVELAVMWLIVASTTGLVLLKFRSEVAEEAPSRQVLTALAPWHL